VIDFFRKLFGQSGSSSTAKERLRLVLMTDHLELAPDMVEAMKRDLVDVISRYVEVDREKIDVTFEQQDKALAMLANIPILAVNRSGNGHAAAPVVAPAPTVAAAPADIEPGAPASEPLDAETSGSETPLVAETPDAETPAIETPAIETPAIETPVVETPAAAQTTDATVTDPKRRRRRRKRKMAGAQQSPETAPAP
jgi:cell division topological specificity factor